MLNNMLKYCKTAKIITPKGDECKAEVSLSEGRISLRLEGKFKIIETDIYTVDFYHEFSGIIKCKCMLRKIGNIVECKKIVKQEVINRRRDVKVPLDAEVTVLLGENEKIAKIRDISAGGIYLSLNTLLEEEGKIICNLPVNDELHSLTAKVVRREESKHGYYGYGCKFDSLTVKQESMLRNYVFRLQKRNMNKKIKPVC